MEQANDKSACISQASTTPTPHPWRPAAGHSTSVEARRVAPAKSRRLLVFASRLNHGRNRFTVVVTASAIVIATSIAVAAVTVVAAATG